MTEPLTIQKAYKTELDPTLKQRQQFLQFAGACRFIYNWGLTKKIEAYKETGKSPSAMTLNKELTALKRSNAPWLYETAHCCLQYSLRNLDNAYAQFFRRARQGGKPGFPQYKSRKRSLGTFKFDIRRFNVSERSIRLSVIGNVRLKEHGYIPANGRLINATVSERAGRWFVSVMVEEELCVDAHARGAVGVDVGISSLATTSNGEKYDNPRALKRHERKLTRTQRTLSRKERGSNNRQKAKRRLARVHARIADIRKDAIHKATTEIVNRYGVIVIEDLNVAGMVKNRRLAKAVSDAGMGEFHRQLAYKATWRGGAVITVDRFFPSSKLCSSCGTKKEVLSLSERTYTCSACGVIIDRDLNAALNLRTVAAKSSDTQNACGATVRLESFEHVARKQELV